MFYLQEVSIGGWQLKHDAGEDETVFKFHRQAVLKPGASVTVGFFPPLSLFQINCISFRINDYINNFIAQSHTIQVVKIQNIVFEKHFSIL